MYNKYASKEFGTCPLVQCAGQPVLPVGLKDEMGADTFKIFCPKCQCVYHPPPVRSRSSHHGGAGAAGVDGAAFGTTFPHLFLMTFSNLVPDPLPQDSAYIPRVFGFRVHMSARQRASGGSIATSSSAAGTRQQQQRELNTVDNNKRSSIAGRRSSEAVSKDKIEPLAGDTPQDQAASNQKGGRKSSTVTNSASKQGVPSYENNPTKEDDSSGKKAKSGKRKDVESGNGNNKKSNGDSNTPSKRRRKPEN